MELVNETADLVNRLTSIMDDSKTNDKYNGIMSVIINTTNAHVNISYTLFLQSFSEKIYDVECDSDTEEYPYELKIELDGVTFFAIMKAVDVVALKDTHPDHFDYISKELQL